MVKSPYEILGVSETASADEVKKAYRKKARENHPDVNPDDPNAAKRMNEINEAYDRITNPEKYARSDVRKGPTTNPYPGSTRQGGAYGGGYANGYGGSGYGQGGYGGNSTGPGGGRSEYDNPYGWPFDDLFGGAWTGTTNTASIHPEVSAQDSPEVIQAINYMNANQYQQAVGILSAIPSTGRNARWYYLSAIAHNGAGNTLTALEQIRKATMMDPNNTSYQQAQRVFQQAGERYQQEGQAQGFTMSSMSPTAICCACCALQYFARILFVGV